MCLGEGLELRDRENPTLTPPREGELVEVLPDPRGNLIDRLEVVGTDQCLDESPTLPSGDRVICFDLRGGLAILSASDETPDREIDQPCVAV